jgi:Surface antigen variable number repeat
MRPGTALRFVLPGVLCALLNAPPVCAQLPERLERCLPYPTYAQEVKDMNAEVAAKMEIKDWPQKIIIDEVKFDGPIHLPDAARKELAAKLKRYDFSPDPDWIKLAWLDRGFFKAEVTTKQQFIKSDHAGEHVSLTVHVDEGSQYRLGSVRFRSSDPDDPLAFPPEELRKRMSLAEGNVFSVEKIRESLDELQRLYRSTGYIDSVVEPLTEFDEVRRRISLTMEVTQDKQFRVGTVEVFGLDPKLEMLLRLRLKPGDIYNAEAVDDFFKENESALPPDISSRDVLAHRNTKSGTVNLRFNIFEACPQPQD